MEGREKVMKVSNEKPNPVSVHFVLVENRRSVILDFSLDFIGVFGSHKTLELSSKIMY